MLGLQTRRALGAAFVIAAMATVASATIAEFKFHRDDVLGTSMDLTVLAADQARADAAEKAALAEIERLRLILSTHDPASEISRAAASAAPMKVSPELIEVLTLCDQWRVRSAGAFNAQLGDLISLWKNAGKDGRTPPDAAAVAALLPRLAKPMWRIDKAAGTVARLDTLRPDVDGLAKGYIIDKAVDALRKADPTLIGICLDIGGDVRVWGAATPNPGGPWTIGVADPKQPAENAPLLAQLRLAAGAVATSGHYARFHTIGGKRYSHILDPRTGRPAAAVEGATAVAPDAATADALATALCVLPPAEGLRLVRSTPGAACLILGADGKQYVTENWKTMAIPTASPAAGKSEIRNPKSEIPAASGGQWPAGYQVDLSVMLGRRGPRPYVGFWVEDAAGKPVRTLAIWGKNKKYIQKLTAWWAFAGKDAALVAAVSRASRAAGAYTLTWDGKDDRGAPVPPGTYTIRVEAVQESGPHVEARGTITCGAKAAKGRATLSSIVTGMEISYGPGK